jgi:ABC-type multidrug transport system ATPase subunit
VVDPDDPRVGVRVQGLSRQFGSTRALDDVSLAIDPGEVHALLGPNGAGKTTLLRIISGLVDADAGEVRIGNLPLARLGFREHRRLLGVVPSGDRSFYLRISGFENLVFFGRLNGLSLVGARDRASACLAEVDLVEAARKRVGEYSHGMQKRLSVARAILMNPAILLVDEATHDLDPEASSRVRTLARAAASNGAAVLWTTQRVDEIRGFVDRVTLLHRGRVRFRGTVPELMATSPATTHLIQLDRLEERHDLLEAARTALRQLGELAPAGNTKDARHFVLTLADGVPVGRAVAALADAGIDVLAFREATPPIESAFLKLTAEGDR